MNTSKQQSTDRNINNETSSHYTNGEDLREQQKQQIEAAQAKAMELTKPRADYIKAELTSILETLNNANDFNSFNNALYMAARRLSVAGSFASETFSILNSPMGYGLHTMASPHQYMGGMSTYQQQPPMMSQSFMAQDQRHGFGSQNPQNGNWMPMQGKPLDLQG